MEIFKVIKIISDTEILINAGANAKIQKGDSLDIFVTGQEIFDPDTNESLGTLDTVKATVEAFVVYPKMCLCRKTVQRTENIFAPTFTKQVTVKKRLKVDASEISGGLSDDLTIHIGDLVRSSVG